MTIEALFRQVSQEPWKGGPDPRFFFSGFFGGGFWPWLAWRTAVLSTNSTGHGTPGGIPFFDDLVRR